TISALLLVVLFIFHLTDDTLHAPDEMNTKGTVIVLAIALVMLWGTVELAGRRLGYLITLLAGLASAYMPFLHTLVPRSTRWGWLLVWTFVMMGVVGLFTSLLSARELWRSFRTRADAASLL